MRQGPKTWAELKKLGLSEKAVDRVLYALEFWKLVEKEDKTNRFSRWVWHEHVKKYETKEDYEIALKHSEDLLLGFDAILREELHLCLLLPHPLADVNRQKATSEGDEFKPSAEEHLKTGYPTTYEVLTEFREALSELQKLKGKYGIGNNVKDVFSHFKIYRDEFFKYLPHRGSSPRFQLPEEDTPSLIKRIRKQRIETFAKMANHFFNIRLQVMNRTPLNGACQLCPKIHIMS